jgi:1,4-dihydroxy-2-naphthoate octaprenyltransferase
MPQRAPGEIPTLRKWLVACRPWALPASAMPVVFGTSLAVVLGGARPAPGRFALALLAMMILHTAANMASDVSDFRRGLDRDVTPVSGALVRGWLTARQVRRAAFLLFAVGSVLGLVLVRLSSPKLLYVGAAGVAVGAAYSFLKSRALGDAAVGLNFGLLGALGAWTVQTRFLSWRPVLWAVPLAMLVMAILHANNWRDIPSDGVRKVTTVASRLGDRGSLIYYGVLVFGPFAVVAGFIFLPRLFVGPLPPLPLAFLVVGFAFPNALALWGRSARRHRPRHPLDFMILDGATARHNLIFGLLATAAVWLQALLRWP